MADEQPRGAVLQFEIERSRWDGSSATFIGEVTETPTKRLRRMAMTAVGDTIANGGTFVLVATADKITMVQRPDAEEL